jgi:hypothetical protein
MDRYGARGELLAAQHETILGPFCVPAGVDQAVEFNCDGTTTIYEHGRTRTETTHRITDERYKLTRDQWAGLMAKSFYDGFYHTCPESFSDEIKTMQSDKCKGTVSVEWSLWLSWASGIIQGVIDDETKLSRYPGRGGVR